MLSLSEFKAEAAKGQYTHVPLVQELLADLDTPMSIYLKLANEPRTYLLESVVGGERFGRYSFIGLRTEEWIEVKRKGLVHHKDGKVEESFDDGDPLAYIEKYIESFKTPEIPGLPRFTGGVVGYFSYESNGLFEKRLYHPDKKDILNVPDVLLMLSHRLVVVDNLKGKIHIIVYADLKDELGYQKAREDIENIRLKLRENYKLPLSFGSAEHPVEEMVKKERFIEMVKKSKQYIEEGDIMQIIPSQCLKVKYDDNPISLYRALRTLNPSPYLIYYDFGDFHVVGSSPEILVRKEKNVMTVRPLAGTAKRGATKEEDLELERKLLADEKEIAEHVMLIDLARNDVGKVCKKGTIKVTDKIKIERYSHVMHIVSNVEGELLDDVGNIDVLKSAFPAGTLSGTPKIRAMEIIDELEEFKRGVYGGAIGYIGFTGDMDMAIAIRCALIKDGNLYCQSGAGIVTDSVPENEWNECMNKAMAVVKAARSVQEGLDNN